MYGCGMPDEEVVREVTASVAEFARCLEVAAPGWVTRLAEGHYRVEHAAAGLEIRLQPTGRRRIGLFDLPVLEARYRFIAGGPEARQRLLEHLDRGMQRGGG